MIIEAHAKINLSLDITAKRANGYHDLDTIMQTISLHDTVEITKNKTGEIKITCSKMGLPTDEHNIAHKAAKKFLEHFNIQDMGVNIHIVKDIPIEAGLGGGSTDAAAVIRGMTELFKIETTEKELIRLAATVGADVPFCLVTGTKRCKGIGEIMTNVPPLPKCQILVCKPPVGSSTKLAYETSDNYPEDNFLGTPALVTALRTGDLNKVAENISNRFDDVLVIPQVTILKALLLSGGALAASMTGSGSAVFGIFDNERIDENLIEELAKISIVYLCEPWKLP